MFKIGDFEEVTNFNKKCNSSIYIDILKNQGQNYLLFFFLCIKRTKYKACALTLSQDAFIFSLLKDTKNE